MEWFWTWLRQPSILRVINIILGIAGMASAPELWAQIVGVMVLVYAIIDGFYNKQPNKPE